MIGIFADLSYVLLLIEFDKPIFLVTLTKIHRLHLIWTLIEQKIQFLPEDIKE